ncbi:hypothetical protein HWV62_41725 [Athelia sp. TMB]|nr:hypothetical protein HWV62_41725 [Athelia sp. TMB]
MNVTIDSLLLDQLVAWRKLQASDQLELELEHDVHVPDESGDSDRTVAEAGVTVPSGSQVPSPQALLNTFVVQAHSSTMASKEPTLGSLAMQAPSLTPHADSGLDLLREYRRLDDTIVMRLNRTNAQFSDRERERKGKGNVQDEACLYIWRSLIENWKRRTEVVSYCVGVVDKAMDEKRQIISDSSSDPARQKAMQSALSIDQVKARQVHTELAVEIIVRKRALDAFQSRCKYFSPPMSDVEARKWWDAAQQSKQ